MDIIVHLGAAILCISQQCFPVLIGKDTPAGEYKLIKRIVADPMYKYSVLQFKETETEVYAIHIIWNGRPKERRDLRIKSKNIKDRIITGGCINVETDLYNSLLNNYQDLTLTILP